MRTRDTLTPAADPNWMLLFVDADRDPRTGWLGYDFVLNRTKPAEPGAALLERHAGLGNQWDAILKVPCRFAEREIEVAIPRSVLQNFESGRGLNFKWSDNIQHDGGVSD